MPAIATARANIQARMYHGGRSDGQRQILLPFGDPALVFRCNGHSSLKDVTGHVPHVVLSGSVIQTDALRRLFAVADLLHPSTPRRRDSGVSDHWPPHSAQVVLVEVAIVYHASMRLRGK